MHLAALPDVLPACRQWLHLLHADRESGRGLLVTDDMHATADDLWYVQVLIFNGIPEMSIAIEVLPTYVKQARPLLLPASCLLQLAP